MDTADVIVVGAGLAGLSTAWHLPPEYRVVVLEQGSAPAEEASAQHSSLIRRMDLDPSDRALARRTFSWLQDPPADWTRPPSQRTGAVLGLGRDPLHLHDAVAHLRAGGVTVQEVSDPAKLSPALCESPLVRAWHLPDEHTADLPALIEGFLRGLKRLGRTPQCNVRVQTLIRSESGQVIGVRTDQGQIHAPMVVLAGGAWSQQLAQDAGLDRPLIPLRRSIAICQTAIPAQGPWIWVDDVGVYVRPEGHNWIASPCDEAVDPPGPGPGSTGEIALSQQDLLISKLSRYFPALAQPRIARGWTGLRTFSPDRRPLLGPDPSLRGLWWAAGLGGAGLSSCIGVGEALSTWMDGQTTDWLDPAPLCPGRTPLRRWSILADGDPRRAQLVDAHPT